MNKKGKKSKTTQFNRVILFNTLNNKLSMPYFNWTNKVFFYTQNLKWFCTFCSFKERQLVFIVFWAQLKKENNLLFPTIKIKLEHSFLEKACCILQCLKAELSVEKTAFE